MSAPRAVVFDLDDTLIVEARFARSSIRNTAKLLPDTDPGTFEEIVLGTARRQWSAGPHHPLCRRLGFASWEGLWSTFAGGHPTIEALRSWVPQYRAGVWRAVLRELGRDDPSLAAALSDAYVAEQRRGHPLIEGAAATVRSVATTARVGMLTNGPPDIQRHKIAGTGLEVCFDAIVVSGEIGVGKPDPDAFAVVLDELGVGPDDATMVGDSWERDIVGALDIGMRAVWISHGRPTPEAMGLPAGRPPSVIDHIGRLADVFS